MKNTIDGVSGRMNAANKQKYIKEKTERLYKNASGEKERDGNYKREDRNIPVLSRRGLKLLKIERNYCFKE